ncbi:hypothetical protein GE061_019793 [Apolygus lucorum]|uniref:Uncharacterized protein n=1 Tax=Apolygus lucorum TaxID=248454 RepID=A0A8S9X935_APOLU|nr:hypothetical protein GE061_019793 [Apolygus lucorum]
MGMRTENEAEWRNMDPLYCELGNIGMVSQLGRREETGSPRLSLRESADTVLPSTFRVVMTPPSPPHHGGSQESPIVTFEERFTMEPALETPDNETLTQQEEWNRGVTSEVTAALCASHDVDPVSPAKTKCELMTVTAGESLGVASGVTPLLYRDEETGTLGGSPGVSPGVSPQIHQEEVTGTPGGSDRNTGCVAGCIAGCIDGWNDTRIPNQNTELELQLE